MTSLLQMARSFAAHPIELNIGIATEVVSAAGMVTLDPRGKATTQEETSVVREAVRGVNLPGLNLRGGTRA